jgi:hypothetical protein
MGVDMAPPSGLQWWIMSEFHAVIPYVPSSWAEIGWVTIDRGVVCFADSSELSREVPLARDEIHAPTDADVMVAPAGRALALLFTHADVDAPVEVQHAGSAIDAARICITDDVDDLPGTWTPVGPISLQSGKCVAGDPFTTSSSGRLEFPVTPGTYVTEVFELTEDGVIDRLALRIRR